LHWFTSQRNAVQSNWSYYTIEKFQWTPRLIGISLGVVGLVFAIVQGGLIRLIIPKLGQQRSVYFGLALYALGFLLYAFATEGWMMYAFTVVYCFGGIAGPALQGIMSGILPPNEHGRTARWLHQHDEALLRLLAHLL